LEYFDIANELARFIFRKPKEDIVDAISNKLSSSLEALRRRGIPVDRLLKQINRQRKLFRFYPKKEDFFNLASVKGHQQKSNEDKYKTYEDKLIIKRILILFRTYLFFGLGL
jgi:hypothetical protein